MSKTPIDYQSIADSITNVVESEDLWIDTVQVVSKLPPQVQNFVFDHCVFLSVGWGCVLPGRLGLNWFTKRSRNQWMILLSEHIPKRERRAVLAHEIAHAWLRHDVLDHKNDPIEIETAAANLAREWGFKGKGANPAFATRGYF